MKVGGARLWTPPFFVNLLVMKKRKINRERRTARGKYFHRDAGVESAKTRRGEGKGSRKGGGAKRVIEYAEGVLNIASGGFGFVRIPEREDDVFIPQHKLRGALNNDTVRVAITKIKEDKPVRVSKRDNSKGVALLGKKSMKSCEGEIVEIIERSRLPYVGLLSITRKGTWVIIENKSMPYDIEVLHYCSDPRAIEIKPEYQGLKVAVMVQDFPKGSLTPRGFVTDILGKAGENNTEMHSILTEYGLPYKFPQEVEDAANKIPKKIVQKDFEERRDFRKVLTFTIDPADAKDFDDAVSLRIMENGNLEVGVHIADVSYYVKPGTILDKEAYERGTSVYLVDRTIPMLPEALSNNLCSLRPGEDKLCFSAVFEMNTAAQVLSRWFGRTVIRSDFRFAYEEAQQIIDNDGSTAEYKSVLATHPHPESLGDPRYTGLTKEVPSAEIASAVMQLHKLATIMRKKRFAHGSISFERPEMKILVDETGKPISVVEKITKSANWLIEEMMLLANREVATHITTQLRKTPPTFVYRIHDEPNMEKVEELRSFVHHFGYQMDDTKNPRQLARALNKLLESLQGKPECETIELLALRCMARAVYSTENIGHYGLGFEYYTHFTSPIRRYPDMMVHRLLSRYLENGNSVDKQKFEDYCTHCSQREQLATEAERSSIKYKMTEYMQERIGQVFDGSITGVTEWGVYVSVEPTKIEGMVSVHEFTDDYYTFDEKNFCLIGHTFGKRLTLGDKVKVRVKATNLAQKTIDFELVTEENIEKN